MFNTFLSFIIKIILQVVKVILDVILSPITLLIKGLFPGVDSYIDTFFDLLNDYLFNGLRFAREVLINMTGLNRNLIGIIFALPLAYFTFGLFNAGIKFIVSIFRIWKTGKDS